MTEPYRGRSDDRRYTGDTADVTYNLKRCIHAAHCVDQLAEVFDRNQRPWINANGAAVDRLLEVVVQCPSGALHLERKDGGIEEAIPQTNRVIVRRNGQLEIRGNLTVTGTMVDLRGETRVTLCRCGASRNKPFCDNSHRDTGFQAEVSNIGNLDPLPDESAVLHIHAQPNGSLELTGKVEIFSEDGEPLFTGTHTWLCRCGSSGNKPFCDASHRSNGFQAE